jgi:hypothetical protein
VRRGREGGGRHGQVDLRPGGAQVDQEVRQGLAHLVPRVVRVDCQGVCVQKSMHERAVQHVGVALSAVVRVIIALPSHEELVPRL